MDNYCAGHSGMKADLTWIKKSQSRTFVLLCSLLPVLVTVAGYMVNVDRTLTRTEMAVASLAKADRTRAHEIDQLASRLRGLENCVRGYHPTPPGPGP